MTLKGIRLAVVNAAMAIMAVTITVPVEAAPIVSPSMSYGTFVGSWDVPSQNPDQPQPNTNNVTTWGNLILAATPGAFEISDFHLAGRNESWNTVTNGAITFTKIDSFNGAWTYNGGANNGLPVDMYVVVKYDNALSIFRFDNIAAGYTGRLTSDYRNIPLPGCPGGSGLGSATFSATCMGMNDNGQPFAISNVTAWWPPGDEIPVPVPASFVLFGLGLAGLAAARRRS